MVIKCLINEECQVKTGHVTWQRKKKKESYNNLSLHKTGSFSFIFIVYPWQSLALDVSSCTIFPSFLPSRKSFIRV